MMADVEAVDIRRQQRAQALPQARALCKQFVDQQAIGFLDGIAALFQCVEHPVGAASHVFDPMLHVLGPGRLRCKVGKLMAAGERDRKSVV